MIEGKQIPAKEEKETKRRTSLIQQPDKKGPIIRLFSRKSRSDDERERSGRDSVRGEEIPRLNIQKVTSYHVASMIHHLWYTRRHTRCIIRGWYSCEYFTQQNIFEIMKNVGGIIGTRTQNVQCGQWQRIPRKILRIFQLRQHTQRDDTQGTFQQFRSFRRRSRSETVSDVLVVDECRLQRGISELKKAIDGDFLAGEGGARAWGG